MSTQDTLTASEEQLGTTTPASTSTSSSGPDANVGSHRALGTAATIGAAFAGYLGLSVLFWWNVWSTHPTGVASCGCNDPSLFMWFMEWPAYAIAHGLNPFYSNALFHPTGINLLSNTSVLAIGIPLAPVTWLFGPVATLNVASTLGPAATALAMFFVLRRWVTWTPAAFVGGLVLGFSPFVFTNLAVDHLMTSVLVPLPLIVACLDELLVRQRRRPLVAGAALGLLAVVEFFLSTEMLLIFVLCAVAGLALLVAYALVSRPPNLSQRAEHAVRGLAVAAAVAAVLLAYPLWFALDGPAHLSGLVWPPQLPGGGPGTGGIRLSDVVDLRYIAPPAVHLFAGYEGPALPEGEYLGLGMLIVLGAGLVAWWRDRRLWFFGAFGILTLVLSIGVNNPDWVPWRVLAHLPIIENVIPGRVYAVTTLCAGTMLAVIVDRTYGSVLGFARGIRKPREPRVRKLSSAPAKISAGILALAVAAVAMVPIGTAVASNVPFTVESIEIPPWFADVAPHLAAGQVLLPFPPAVAGGSAMIWQAVDSLYFAMPTGGGPESIPSRAGPERDGLNVITSASVVLETPDRATPTNIASVRAALAGWGVTMVVVPYPADTAPRYDRESGTAWALGMFTLAIGREPQYDHGAWVWSDVRSPGPMLTTTTGDFARCTDGRTWTVDALQAVPGCMTSTPRRT
jgi:hypothetical protein